MNPVRKVIPVTNVENPSLPSKTASKTDDMSKNLRNSISENSRHPLPPMPANTICGFTLIGHGLTQSGNIENVSGIQIKQQPALSEDESLVVLNAAPGLGRLDLFVLPQLTC